MTAEETAVARAGRGAKLLDKVAPGWATEARLSRLVMSDCDNCILAQVAEAHGFGRAYEAGKQLVAQYTGRPFTEQMQTLYGVNTSPNFRDKVWFSHLTAAWKDEIRDRR